MTINLGLKVKVKGQNAVGGTGARAILVVPKMSDVIFAGIISLHRHTQSRCGQFIPTQCGLCVGHNH